MRILTLAVTTALTLAAAACDRRDASGDTADATLAAEDSAGQTSAVASADPRAAGATAPADSAAPESLGVGVSTDPVPAGPGPVTQAQRDDAKAAAEATNLHPRTP